MDLRGAPQQGTEQDIQLWLNDLYEWLKNPYAHLNSTYGYSIDGYRVDPSETDQGITGNGKTIKAYVDEIGSTIKATIFLPHDAEAGSTTTYTLSTSETIPSNITLKAAPGAIIAIATGITLTLDAIDALPNQQIFSLTGTGAVKVTTIPSFWIHWLGFSTSESTTNNATYFGQAITAVIDSGIPIKITAGVFPLGSVAYTASGAVSLVISGVHSPASDDTSPPGTILSFSGLTGSQIGLSISGGANAYVKGLTLEDLWLIGPSAHHSTQATTSTGLFLDGIIKLNQNNVQTSAFHTGWKSGANSISNGAVYGFRAFQCYIGRHMQLGANSIGWYSPNFTTNYLGSLITGGNTCVDYTPVIQGANSKIGYVLDPVDNDLDSFTIIGPWFEALGDDAIRLYLDYTGVSGSPDAAHGSNLIRDFTLINPTFNSITGYRINAGNDVNLTAPVNIHGGSNYISSTQTTNLDGKINWYRNKISIQTHETTGPLNVTDDFHVTSDGGVIVGSGNELAKYISVTDTWDVGSLADGASARGTFTVTGAAVGDLAVAGLTSVSAQAGANRMWQITAHATDTNEVLVTITNNTGSTIDLASGTVRISVFKH